MSKLPDSNDLKALPEPPSWPNGNSNLLLGHGAFIEPIVRLSIFSDEEFEIFTLQWAKHTLEPTYYHVQRYGGSGDKGRDVVGWIDPPRTPRRKWDNYQCKHYKDPLSPSVFGPEIAKLVYYTFRGDYTLPERYVIVTHKDVGPKLGDLLEKPQDLKDYVEENWKSYEGKITKGKKVTLSSGLKSHLHSIDFSIFEALPPSSLLEGHKRSVPYHALIFGVGLKPRPVPKPAPECIQKTELVYVKKIYHAISDSLNRDIRSPDDFQSKKQMTWQFHNARECFYSAEALKVFARDSIPDFPSIASDLTNEVLKGVDITLHRTFNNGYDRMIKVCEKVQGIEIKPTILAKELLASDRTGLLHHLANDGQIDWVDP